MKKAKLIPVFAFAVLAASVFGTSAIYAQDDTTSTTIVQRIASKFNLNEDEVQAVFDSEREERKAEMEARFAEKLDEAVSEGRLTSSQKELIQEKRAELDAMREAHRKDHEALSEMTQEERDAMRSEMEAERDDLKNWAEENNIDLKYLMGFGMKGHGGFGGPQFDGRGERSVL